MSFRRSGKQIHDWQQWVADHRDALLESGVPDWIYSDELRWERMLEEGGWDVQTGWKVELMSIEEAQRLHKFILDKCGNAGNSSYRSCLRSLEKMIGTTNE